MVTVAKSFDAPIKLLWPKDLLAEELQFSMLGLGDIVIPGITDLFFFRCSRPNSGLVGIFIALMIRFDAFRSRKQYKNKDFPRPYFTFTFVGYILGMVATISVMHFFQAAQVLIVVT